MFQHSPNSDPRTALFVSSAEKMDGASEPRRDGRGRSGSAILGSRRSTCRLPGLARHGAAGRAGQGALDSTAPLVAMRADQRAQHTHGLRIPGSTN